MMKLFALALSVTTVSALALPVTTVSAGFCKDKRPGCKEWARDNECMGDNAVRPRTHPTTLGHRPPTQLLGILSAEMDGDRVPPVLRHLHTLVQRHGHLLRRAGHRW
eukprot:scaffold95307_cov52-Phaeocystis_antarctica.AAC.2